MVAPQVAPLQVSPTKAVHQSPYYCTVALHVAHTSRPPKSPPIQSLSGIQVAHQRYKLPDKHSSLKLLLKLLSNISKSFTQAPILDFLSLNLSSKLSSKLFHPSSHAKSLSHKLTPKLPAKLSLYRETILTCDFAEPLGLPLATCSWVTC